MARPKQNVVVLTGDEISALQKIVRTHCNAPDCQDTNLKNLR